MNNSSFSSFQISKYQFFYPSEIIWKCQKCTLCCKDSSNHIRRIKLLKEECITLSHIINIPIEQFAIHTNDKIYPYEILKINGKCIFLKNNLCEIYENRPLVCQFYPFEMHLIQNNFYKIFLSSKECNSIGKGKKLQEQYFKNLTKKALKHFKN